jgi:hypothetical protein
MVLKNAGRKSLHGRGSGRIHTFLTHLALYGAKRGEERKMVCCDVMIFL